MVQNPAGLYGGGAFLVDTTPIVNLYAKKQAQDEAKRTALTKYFTDILDKATPTGMRNLEIPAFIQSKDNYQRFSIENADKLANGDPATVMQAMQLAKIPQKIAQESKNLRTIDTDVAKITLSNPDVKDRWDDETRAYWDKHEKPKYIVSQNGEVVENPYHSTFDISGITLNPKMLSESEMQNMADKQVDDIKPEPLGIPTIKPHPTDRFQQIETTTKGFTKDKLQASAERFRDLYKDPSIRYTFNKRHPLSEMTEDKIKELSNVNNLYKQVYGKDIPENNPEELYVATNLYRKSLPTIEEKLAPNKAYIESQAYSKARALLFLKQDMEKPQIQGAKTPFEETKGEYITSDGKKIKIDASGYVVDENGNPYSSPDGKFDIAIPRNNFSPKLIETLPKSKYKDLVEDMNFTVKNGVIQAAQTPDKFGGGLVTRRQLLLNIAKEKKYPNLSEAELKKMDIQREKTEKKIVPSTPKGKIKTVNIPLLKKP